MDEIRVKKIVHRANYRGIKEVDLILGGFAKAYATTFSNSELEQFEALLAQKDHDIYDWICERQKPPKQFDTSLFKKICAYKHDSAK